MSNKITLFSLVRGECANLMNGDTCLGMDTTNWPLVPLRGGDKCWIIDKKKHCECFVRCVLPLAPELKEKYTALTLHVLDDAHKEEKKCKCGNILSDNERKCAICKRKTRRLRNRKFRGSR